MENDLDQLKLISKKADLIQELMTKIAKIISEIANREDMLALSVNDQISIIASTFVSLSMHYKLNTGEVVSVTNPDEINRAQEIVKLEEQLNKEKEDA